MGVIKDSLPPVPEDRNVHERNRLLNEKHKKKKDEKKAKTLRRTQRRELHEKAIREAEKAGVEPPPTPESSGSEAEGGGDDYGWIDQLVEEEDEDPLADEAGTSEGPNTRGGPDVPEGSRAREGLSVPEGSQTQGGGESVPRIVVGEEDDSLRGDSAPVAPEEGEKESGAAPEVIHHPSAPGDLPEPSPLPGVGTGAPVGASRSGSTVVSPVPSAAAGVMAEPRSTPGSLKRSIPRARYAS